MELNRLEHFIAVAEQRRFTAAARRLHLASVHALERELGTPLFERAGTQLSDAGRALLPEAHRVIAAARAARQAVSDARAGQRQPVNVGIPHGLLPPGLFATLTAFGVQHPGVDLRFVGAGGRGCADQADGLRAGRLDVAFLVRAAAGTGLRMHVVATEPVLLATAADHRLGGRDTVELTDLRDEGFVDFPAGWGVRAVVDEVFATAGVGRRPVAEIGDAATALDLVRHRLGVTLVPRSWAARATDLRYAELGPPRPMVEVVVATPDSAVPTASTVALVAAVLRAADETT
ncbi:LysR family transcriptional regulator [Polymorphospora lycopeni]|uniref:LysR family transcriptional regulator n=1 Tax=Polymorphospora lycopeni TaxID=3140240 RepID=A0ABV5CZ87_9ACTN